MGETCDGQVFKYFLPGGKGINNIGILAAIMILTKLPGMIEHTDLSADLHETDIRKLADTVLKHKFRALVVRPKFVRKAKEFIGRDAKVVTVIGWPSGAQPTKDKVEEISRAIADGADEFDVVMKVAAFKSGEHARVLEDMKACIGAAHARKVKIIIETGFLTPEEIDKACALVLQSGASAVKTSTGNLKGATADAVQRIKKAVGERLAIKASGGIRTIEQAAAMADAGATLIGTSTGPDLVRGKMH